MKTILNAIVALLLIGIVSCKPNLDNTKSCNHREKKSINQNWQFKTGKMDIGDWEVVDLPHTPKIEPLVVNNQWQGTMWYKKSLIVFDQNKKYFLNFEGVMQDAELWINENSVAKHNGGYLPFNVDITSYLNINKENEIKLKVTNIDNPITPPGKPLKTLDFNTYGGIYRDVYLTTTNPIYITDAIIENKPASGGILVHFDKVTSQKATGIIKVHVRNDEYETSELFCEVDLVSPIGTKNSFKAKLQNLKSQNDTEFNIAINLDNPELWSITNPELYKLEVKLFANQKMVDCKTLKIGIRDIELKADGFYINHEKIYIRGTNRHQEYPYVGYAISNNANYRDAFKIKDAGFDFVRLSHYPQDESFLEACDELGILVMNAIPGWQFIGDSTFIENSYQDIRDMVRRDRNHPSIILWENSLNESAMTDEYMVIANEILKEELPFDDTYSAGWIDYELYDLFIPARQHGKPPYYWNNYKINERPVFISEYGDWEYYAQNAGFNQTSFKNLKEEERSSRQLRGAGEQRLLQQALNYQEAANSNKKGASTIGDANWLMFDYNRGYANDIESSGISDIFRIPKFAYYFYKSQRPVAENKFNKPNEPFVFIANYLYKTKNIEVKVFSNCDEVELISNNLSLGNNVPDSDIYSDNIQQAPFTFNNITVNNSLTAIGKISGKEVTRTTIYKPQVADKINLTADISGKPLESGCNDLIFIYAMIVDANNQQVYNFNKEVRFNIEGDASIVGGKVVNAEAGIATVLIKIGKKTGSVKLEAVSQNKISGIIKLDSK